MRILWLTTAVIAVLLFFIWVGLIKFQSPGLSGQTANPLSYFTDLFQKAKTQVTLFQDSGSTSTPETEIALKSFRLNSANKTLSVNFSVKNNSADILNFLGPDLSSITLTDGPQKLPLTKITQNGGGAFPKRILSSAEVTGQMVFPLPQEKVVTLDITKLSFLEAPDQTFSKTLTLDLASSQVQNLLQSQKPRD